MLIFLKLEIKEHISASQRLHSKLIHYHKQVLSQKHNIRKETPIIIPMMDPSKIRSTHEIKNYHDVKSVTDILI